MPRPKQSPPEPRPSPPGRAKPGETKAAGSEGDGLPFPDPDFPPGPPTHARAEDARGGRGGRRRACRGGNAGSVAEGFPAPAIRPVKAEDIGASAFRWL